MAALRTTRPTPGVPLPAGRPRFRRLLAATLGVALVGLTGCSGGDPVAAAPPEQTPYRPLMTRLPPPDAERIECHGRTLTFYDLPASGRWMVSRPGADHPYPVGPEHTLPEPVRPDHTLVYYVRPGGQESRPVTLAQIQASRATHMSVNR